MKPVLMISALALLIAPAALADDAAVYVTEPLMIPADGAYVNIGEYTGGTVGTLQTAPITITETNPIITEPILYPVTQNPVETSVIYQPAPAYTPAPVDFKDSEYEYSRLATYDANRDGQVTAREAIATLKPLVAPAAFTSPDYRPIIE